MTDDLGRSVRWMWVERLARFDHASQTVAEFCADEGVSPASFYQWRRRLRAEVPAAETTARFVPVQLPTTTPAESTAVLSLELPGGVRVRLEVIGAVTEQP